MDADRLKEHLCAVEDYFPITSMSSVTRLFEKNLQSGSSKGSNDLNILLVSLVLGYLEHALTLTDDHDFSRQMSLFQQFPVLTFARYEALILDFFHLLEFPVIRPVQSSVGLRSQSKKRKACRTTRSKRARTSLSNYEMPVTSETVEPLSPLEDIENFPTVPLEPAPTSSALSAMLTKWRQEESYNLTRLVWKLTCLICRSLNTKHKSDSPHHQSAFSFIHNNQLDTFGLALVVTATWRALNLEQYGHCSLCLSEDHAWVEIEPSVQPLDDDNSRDSNKSNSNARIIFDVSAVAAHFELVQQHQRQQFQIPSATSLGEHVEEDERMLYHCWPADEERKTWLYLNGHPIRCSSSSQCIAAAVTALDSTTSAPILQETGGNSKRRSHSGSGARTNCELVKKLQHCLLHVLYNYSIQPSGIDSCMRAYPLALSTLADLCESNPKDEIHNQQPQLFPSVYDLHKEAITACRLFYDNRLVYPYLTTANYCYRLGRWGEVLRLWADAAHVISRYIYTATDAEVYNEFLDIACNRMPQMMRLPRSSSADIFLYSSLKNSPEAFCEYLRFFDGICLWEEGSPRPVLHIVWAQKFISILQSFNPSLRCHFHFVDQPPSPHSSGVKLDSPGTTTQECSDKQNKVMKHVMFSNECDESIERMRHEDVEEESRVLFHPDTLDSPSCFLEPLHESIKDQLVNSVDSGIPFEELHPGFNTALPSVISAVGSSLSPATPFHHHLLDEEMLPTSMETPGFTADQDLSILLPDSCYSSLGNETSSNFLNYPPSSSLPDIRHLVEEFCSLSAALSTSSAPFPSNQNAPISFSEPIKRNNNNVCKKDKESISATSSDPVAPCQLISRHETNLNNPPKIQSFHHQLGPALHSQKMRSLRHLLATWRVNAHAIELLLTAQIQVKNKGQSESNKSDSGTTSHGTRVSTRKRTPRFLDFW